MKQTIRISLIVMLFLLLILINTNVYATSGTTINSNTRVRKEASTSADIVTVISQGEEVEIIAEEGDWYQISYSSYTGYIRKDLLNIDETLEEETSDANTAVTEATENDKEQTAEENTENNTEPEQTTENNETIQNEATEEQTETESNSLEIKAGYKGTTTNSIEVRILPTAVSSIISTLSENTEFTVIEVINKWCHIETEEISGWIFLSKIDLSITNKTETVAETKEEEKNSDEEVDKEEEENTNETSKEDVEENTTNTDNSETNTTIKYVSTETLNMREATESNSSIVIQLSLNTQVTVVEEVDNSWTKVTYNGQTGYVASQYLSDTKVTTTSRSENIERTNENTEKTTENSETTTEDTTSTKETTSNNTSSSSSTTGEEIVAFAKQYLGYKYVSGGASPSTGFDCSGFTYYVYKNFGITLSRSSSAQASNGTAVSKSDLQVGDLVIFNNSSNSAVGHVGIYIGGGSFIHAANASKGVVTTSLSTSYYSSRFVTGRRVI